MKRLLIVAICVAATAASAQTALRCESANGKYTECRTNGFGRVTLTHQLSDTACVEGQTWGTHNGMVWVDRGCRADFLVGTDNVVMGDNRLVCESENNTRHTCRADVRGGVTLVRTLSKNDCIRGRSWGTTRNGVWVDRGCRAEFAVGNASLQAANARTLVCESQNNGKTRCSADTTYGVQLTRQISKNNCQLGRDWGYDQRGIWVDRGCRAEFTLGGYNNAGYNNAAYNNGGYVNPPMTSSARPVVLCESVNNGRNRCRADTSYGVSLSRQISSNSCVRGESWDYDRNGIWVDRGCRAEFVLDGNR